ncbi:11-beta-hydroxysteroid dehydrogenase 1B [Heracleum sosnowskyi]|uniref:11-beta-hydroxysteroid dehydrogenase 1B n=1 Tax=Heracleum sosnowskyi TaxID=360622 RepID=A0AAD8MHE0_9APIA|nr:11-beta-hydroxysteroid dehydrogenase 1B [Heracleum sosnowskyi]
MKKDVINKFLNILLPFISIILAVVVLPPFLLFKLVYSLVRTTFFIEDVAGKVVAITGASSGIGEHVAYEYAKRGACLVLVARREDRLRVVADKAKQLGSPHVLVVRADVSNTEDCKNFVDQTILHFHKLDHLVNNAGIAPVCMFEDYEDVCDHKSVMDVNFWGSVYCTQFAIPHLKQSRGKIIVLSSVVGWCNFPRLSIYGATKAALISFFETLRVEVGSEIGITIVTPGLVDSEITDSEFMSKTNAKFVPMESVEGCAQAIVNGTRCGDRFIMEPAWLKPLFYWKLLCPELMEWFTRLVVVTRRSSSLIEDVSGKVVVITGASSGLGENLAYEYAKRGACLVLVARREDRLRVVADKAKQLGSPDVLVVRADVSDTADCKNFVDQTINHFHKLDHLVNNAGVAPVCMFEDYKDGCDHKSSMDVNFWGAVYSTQSALPHLKKSKGKIIAISSVLGWSSCPRLSIYCATKAALISFFETLRIEVGTEIGITIVTPGMLESDLTSDDFLSKTNAKFVPLESVEGCAEAIVNGTRCGDRFLMEPAWLNPLFYWQMLCPELMEWSSRFALITWPNQSGKKTS